MVLFAHVTTRIPGEKYDNLLTEKGGRGFPHLAYLDAEGEVIGQPAGRTVEDFAQGAEHLSVWQALKDKSDLSADDGARLLVAEIALEKLSLAEAQSRYDALSGLNAEQKAEIEGHLVDLRVTDLVEKKQPRTAEQAAELGKTIYEDLYKQGLKPRGKAFQTYYILIMRYGETAGDAEVFKVGLAGMRERFGDNPSARKFFEQAEATLQRLEQK